MLKPHSCDRTHVGMGCTIPIEEARDKTTGDLNFEVFGFISREYGGNKTGKAFTFNTALKGPSLLYTFFNKETMSATIVNFLVKFTRS